MHIRPWDRDKDYDTLVKWWNEWEFGGVPKECLPPDGIMVEVDNNLFVQGVSMCVMEQHLDFMEWVVTDKNAPQRTVHRCLKMCIDI
jgi:hypothetical protein